LYYVRLSHILLNTVLLCYNRDKPDAGYEIKF